ncbi:MAG: 4-hydroxy-tetrahydrodipicolinate synthase [Clostridia bacterium]|nr:4-hydroxy-tetrahydrodipicolinate synthase [Clostridia bacterium]
MKKNKKIPFRGAATALVTPFSDGRIDLDSLRRLIEFQIDGGISAIVVLGTTGENPTVETDERQRITEAAAEQIGGRIPLIVGTGSNSTEHAVFLTKLACQAGADYVLAVTPYYNKANADGLIRHFTAVADASCCPVILYNVPSRTGINIPIGVYRELAKHGNIVGVKESSGSMTQAAEILAETDLALYSGNDGDNVPLLSLGAAGVISVLSNIMPREVSEMCDAAFSRDFALASRMQVAYTSLISALFSDVNPIVVKSALALMGLCRDEMRLPLTSLSADKREKLIYEMKKAGIYLP